MPTASTLPAPADTKDTYLAALGERTRALRARRGLTRKGLAQAAAVSERHLANVEMGVGNATVQFLRQLAEALNCSLAELVGDDTAAAPEWLMIRALLRGRSDADLARARVALASLFGADATTADVAGRRRRIALVGLRGAGKSSLGRLLAERRGLPFVEINRRIEALAGCTLSELHSLYGPVAYRRYERRALEETLNEHAAAVIAAPGGIVSEPATFNLLLAACHTVWLRATPEEHMARVLAQGDMRPMAGHGNEAMSDLKQILASRAAFYARADDVFDTGGQPLAVALDRLARQVDAALGDGR